MTIEKRIAKLEEHSRGSDLQLLSKSERDAKVAASIDSIQPIAVIVQTPDELENHLQSSAQYHNTNIASLDQVKGNTAVFSAIARRVFADVRKPSFSGPMET